VCGIPVNMNSKAAEAELINRATQTAIVAARSILMSGGSEEVALKTAKAAAESVLNPMISDTDTLSGRSSLGSAFGGKRRKAKRQAEVVASMALMSASTGIRPNGSEGMAEWDSIGPHNNPFGRNVITIRQDEPSVLSGSISTRPPRMPTPKSQVSHATSVQKRSSSSTYKLSTPPTSASSDMSPRAFDRNGQSESGAASAMSFSNALSPLGKSGNTTVGAKESPKDDSIKDKGSKYESQSNFLDKILNMKVGDSNINTTKEDKSKVAAMLRDMECDSVNQSGTMDSDRQSSTASSLADDETADTSTVDTANQHRTDKERDTSWSLDPLIVQMTGALNIFACGPLGTFMNGQAVDDMEDTDTIGSANNSATRKSKRDRHGAVMESRDDTFDDNTTSYTCDDTEISERDVRTDRKDARIEDHDDDDNHSDYRDPDFGVIASRSTDSSTNLLRELVMSDISEGAIQVRSSIRETMEKIVSKSNRGRNNRSMRGGARAGDSDPDKTWLSYELRQKDDRAEKVTSSLHQGSKTKKVSDSRRTPKAAKDMKASKVGSKDTKSSKVTKVPTSTVSKGLKKKSPSFFFKTNKK
jgi:hypothetical protein